MNWETFYLTAFVIGFMLSLLSFLSSVIHIPHFHFHGHARGSGLSPFNFGTLAAFLAWFGGTGYLLERYSNIWIYLGLAISVMSGLGGAAIVFWFLVKLIRSDENLDPEDFEMVGVLGRVASPIRPGGTGELIYSRAGARSAAPARSENGTSISRDTEVIVTRYEKGIAYVRPWEEMSGERY
jgi:membrane protein implicated in regulation of membrane protease activity